MASNSATAIASQQSIKAYVTTSIAAAVAASVTLSAVTDEDSNGDAMLKDHAYLATSDGYVVAISLSGADGTQLNGYVGSTSDPEGSGNRVGAFNRKGENWNLSTGFIVPKDESFEITTSGNGTADSILWWSFGTLSKPDDRD